MTEDKKNEVSLKDKPELRSPLAYMLQVINDPKATTVRRDRMAALALPYCHSKRAEYLGKKEEATKEAEVAGQDTKWGDKLRQVDHSRQSIKKSLF